MRAGADGAVTGWAALRLFGAAFFDGLSPRGSPLPVPLVSPRRLVKTPGSTTSRASLRGQRIWTVQGIRCVGVERAVVDEAIRVADLREAVVVIDMACAARITSLRRIDAHLARWPRPGANAVRAALAHADEHSLSPPETRMRLVWTLDGDWPRPLCNPLLYTLRGEILGRPDLLDPTTGTVGEYDGAHHRDRARHRRDVVRLDRFRLAGLEPFVIVAGDTVLQQLWRMGNARARALRRWGSSRDWTLSRPGSPELGEISLDEELNDRGWPSD